MGTGHLSASSNAPSSVPEGVLERLDRDYGTPSAPAQMSNARACQHMFTGPGRAASAEIIQGRPQGTYLDVFGRSHGHEADGALIAEHLVGESPDGPGVQQKVSKRTYGSPSLR